MAFSSSYGAGPRADLPEHPPRADRPGVGKRTLVQQLEATLQRPAAPAPDSAEVMAHAQQGLTGPAQRLPFLDRIQASFGRHDVTGVQAHIGGPAADATQAMGAQAYATGSSVAFGAAPDLHTAAHEAAHVVQQRGGVHLTDGVGRDGDPHERHADAVAERVVQGKSSQDLLDTHTGVGATGGAAVQQRAIPPATYRDYDDNAARESTKALLKAAKDEDTVLGYTTDANAQKVAMDLLKTDEFVGAKATAGSGELDANVLIVTAAAATITAQLDLAISAYTTSVAQAGEAPRRDQRLPIKEGMAQLAAANAARDRLILEAMQAHATAIGQQYQAAALALVKIRRTVTQLTKESSDLGKAKAAYTANLKVKTDIDASDLAQRAPGVGLAVPDVGAAYATAAGHAGRAEWIDASAVSTPARQQLDTAKARIEDAERDQQDYNDLRAQFRLVALRGDFTRLRLDDAQLVAVEADAARAAVHHGAQRWKDAAAQARKVTQALAPLRDLVVKFDAYCDGTAQSKLLLGTVRAVHDELGRLGIRDNARALASLEATYRSQCTISRENWLLHLGIAGGNTVPPNDADYHYTTFNDSVPNPMAERVDNQPEAALRAALFANVAWHRQIHATLGIGLDRYHRYWDGTESANVAGLQAAQPAQYQRLRDKYDEMVRDMTAGVHTAKANHGRVAHNDRGQQTLPVIV